MKAAESYLRSSFKIIARCVKLCDVVQFISFTVVSEAYVNLRVSSRSEFISSKHVDLILNIFSCFTQKLTHWN